MKLALALGLSLLAPTSAALAASPATCFFAARGLLGSPQAALELCANGGDMAVVDCARSVQAALGQDSRKVVALCRRRGIVLPAASAAKADDGGLQYTLFGTGVLTLTQDVGCVSSVTAAGTLVLTCPANTLTGSQEGEAATPPKG